ncbi:MAG: nuclear transport factor 2 family protein, partial [Prosthecochloris sp.]|nr:nuclear transport factor 2 family protein [Prosthecochloris sp.]
MSRVSISLALALFMLIASPLFAAVNAQYPGEKLVRKLFADMKSGNVTSIEAMISPAFQSAHQDGARDRDQEIELIRNLKMGTFSLGDFKESREGDVLVVTYTV